MNHNISEAVRCAKHAQHYDIMYLAQAVGELLEYQNTRKLGAALGQVLRKQPEPEPVALETVYETIIHWDEGGGKRSRRELARRIVSLYTTPQRKPLTDEEIKTRTDEQIEATFKMCGGRWNGDHWVIEDADLHPFVRAIEGPELNTLRAISDEYNAWIKHHAKGHTYDDFLAKRLAAHGIKE